METLFRGSGAVLHWGDTVPDNIRAVNRTIKMDLRIINSLDDEKIMPDFATGEIAKSILKSKFYKDKLKAVLLSKMDLNQIIESSSKFNESTLCYLVRIKKTIKFNETEKSYIFI